MSFLTALSETFDTEIKGWLDPANPADAANLARACIALRNNNGGRLIIGFDNKTLEKSSVGTPDNVKQVYHADTIQQIISKYALPKFDVELIFEERDGQIHPIVLVKAGVESPVMTRSAFAKELRQNTVYVRTLSNNTVSSSEPKTPDDWDRLIRICFDNREADIGRFFRRHIHAISKELTEPPVAVTVATPSQPVVEAKRPITPTADFLDEGKTQFDARIKEKVAEGKIAPVTISGLREVSFAVQGDFEQPTVKHLLDKLFIQQPHYTGWPPWLDSRGFTNVESRPYVKKGGWEALIVGDLPWEKNHIDFWRIEPTGRFYCLQTFQDDTSTSLLGRGVKPGQLFDFFLLISRTAEIIGTAKAFAEALNPNPKHSMLELVFRLTGLRGRNICCWVEPARSLSYSVKAEDTEVVSKCLIPLETPQPALWQFVKVITQPVFDVFGSGVGDSIIEEITNRTLNRG